MTVVRSGAEPITHVAVANQHVAGATKPTGVVCLHGFGGTPATVKPVADALAHSGFNVIAPRLPGHGTSPRDMATTGWTDWQKAATEAIRTVGETSHRTIVVGISMGATLALSLASHGEQVDAIVVINPLLDVDPEMVEQVNAFLDMGAREIDDAPSDIKDQSVTEIGYETVSLHALASLYEGASATVNALGSITVPTLVITSRNDHVVPPSNSGLVVDALGALARQVWLDESYHVATLDLEHRLVTDHIVGFIASL